MLASNINKVIHVIEAASRDLEELHPYHDIGDLPYRIGIPPLPK
jgi:hypothetical protein